MRKSSYNQGLCALTSGYGALLSALTLGYSSPATPSLQNDSQINPSEEQISWIGAGISGTALIGSLLAAPLIEKYGRKSVTLYICFPYILSWILIGYSRTANEIILARLLSGLCMGIERVAMSVYLTETVHISMRGILMPLPGFMMTGGLVFINFAGNFLNWRELGWLGAAAIIPFIGLLFCIPETPYFLVKKEEHPKAMECLNWLRDEEKVATREMLDLRLTIRESRKQKSSQLSSLFEKPNRWGFGVAVSLHILQQLTGITALFSFLTLAFEDAGTSSSQAQFYSVIISLINFLTMFLSSYLLANYPRKIFLKISSFPMIISLVCLSAYIFTLKAGGLAANSFQSIPLIPLIVLSIYFFSFSIGWGPLPWVFLGEGLSSDIRGTGSAIGIATNWAFAFITSKSFIWCKTAIGLEFVYLLYASFTFVGMILLTEYMPETFQKSSKEIDDFYIKSYRKDSMAKKKN